MKIADILTGKKILIWGYGREGKSTEHFIIDHNIDCEYDIFEGKYEDIDCDKYDIIVKSPGIKCHEDNIKFTSQTELMLAQFAKNIIGITGTKGKSTTASMLYTTLRNCGVDCVLVGNIGRPCLERYDEIMEQLNDPNVVSDQNNFRKLMKEQSDLAPIVEAYKAYKEAKQTVEDSLMILDEESDEEMRELAKEEMNEAKEQITELEEKLKILLLPKDENDDKNVVVEIRGGAGGDEAALFAAELYRMYCMYAETQHWKTEMISVNENGLGGFKEVVFMINGQGAYSKLKYESGVHRVQRIPVTESGGRIHTSTATVAIMPEAEEVDVEIDMNDCRFDVFRASGNGGQCVNTTDSAVRLTHIPTGIVISCQDEKSQLKNKDKALKVLRARLYELECQKKQDAESEARRSQIGTGDRSEKIRTYNFPQGRVTDHRIKFTSHRLDEILNGHLEEIIDNCIAADQAAKLSNMND